MYVRNLLQPDCSPAADCVHKYFLEQLNYSKLVLLLLTWITHASWLPIKSHHFGHKQACYFTIVDTQYQACKFASTYNCMPQRQPGWIQKKFLRRGGEGGWIRAGSFGKSGQEKHLCSYRRFFTDHFSYKTFPNCQLKEGTPLNLPLVRLWNLKGKYTNTEIIILCVVV